jgi:hypothetical protein
MNLRRGFRRAAVLLTILYWAIVIKYALLFASWGPWGYCQTPIQFLVCAVFAYMFIFGLFWTIDGFLGEPHGPC